MEAQDTVASLAAGETQAGGAVSLEKTWHYRPAIPGSIEFLNGLKAIVFSEDETRFYTVFATEVSLIQTVTEVAEWDVSTGELLQYFRMGDDVWETYSSSSGFYPFLAMSLQRNPKDGLLLMTDSADFQVNFEQKKLIKLSGQARYMPPQRPVAEYGKTQAEAHAWEPKIKVSGAFSRELLVPGDQFAQYTSLAFCFGDSLLAAVQQQEHSLVLGGMQIRFFEVRSQDLRATVPLPGQSPVVKSLFLPRSKKLVTCQQNGDLRIWNLEQLQENRQAPDMLRETRLVVQTGHQNAVQAVAFSNDGKRMASGGTDGVILLREMQTGLHHTPINAREDVEQLWFSNDGQHLYVRTAREFQIWSTQIPAKLIRTFTVTDAFYAPESNRILMPSPESGLTLEIWSSQNLGAPLTSVRLPEPYEYWSWMAVTNDGKRILLRDGLHVIVFSIESGKTLFEKKDSIKTNTAAFDETGKTVLLGRDDGWVEVYHLEKGNLQSRFFTGCMVGYLNSRKWSVTYDPTEAGGCPVQTLVVKGGRLYTGGKFANIAVWDYTTGMRLGEMIHDDPLPRWMSRPEAISFNPAYNPVYCLAVGADGQMLASGSDRSTVKVWKLPDGRLLRTHAMRVNAVSSAVFHPVENTLVTATNNRFANTLFAAFGNFGAYTAPDTLLKIWSFLPSGIRFETLNGLDNWSQKLFFTPDGQQLVSFDAFGKLNKWQWANRVKSPEVQYHDFTAELTPSPFDQKFAKVKARGNDSTDIDIYVLDSPEPLAHFRAPAQAGNMVRFLDKNTARIFFRDLDPIVFELDLAQKTFRKLEDFPKPPFDMLYDYQKDAARKLVWLPGRSGLYAQSDGQDSVLVRSEYRFFNADIYRFDNRLNYLAVAETDEFFKALETYSIKVLQLPEGREILSAPAHSKQINGLSFNAGSTLLASSSVDGWVKIWDLVQKRQVLGLLADHSGNYIALTDGNYYQASKGAHQMLAFERGNQLFSFDQFDLKFNRPDKVLKQLSIATDTVVLAYHRAYQKRLQKMRFTEAMLGDDFDLPVLHLEGEAPPGNTEARTIWVKIAAFASADSEKKNSKTPLLDRINVFINDVPVYGIEGIDLRGHGSAEHRQSVELTLAPGDNKIQLSVLNQAGVESLKETFYINCTAPPRKPDLYLIGIGAGSFQDASMNLTYPVKDLRDLTSFFVKNGKLFGNIFVDTIFDAALDANALKSLKSRLMQTNVDDCVVLSIAGHGILDDSLDYFFATSHTDFRNPRGRAIPYEALEGLLDAIPARQKLMLLDACHAGEIDKESVKQIQTKRTVTGNIQFRSVGGAELVPRLGLENSFDLMKELFVDLRRGTGATVIGSAAGAEPAMEGDAWKNSVFMFALLSGLQNRAADLNRDNRIMVSELQQYLGAEVERLTDGKQRPTSRLENVEHDWQIF